MGNMNDYFPSPWLKGDDLEAPIQATVKSVVEEQFSGDRGDPDEVRPVVKFEEISKGLVLNKTNFQMLAAIAGEANTENWGGTKVELRAEKVAAFGKIHNSVRLHPPSSDGESSSDEKPSF